MPRNVSESQIEVKFWVQDQEKFPQLGPNQGKNNFQNLALIQDIITVNFGFSSTNKNEIIPSEGASIYGALHDYGIKQELNCHKVNLRKD